jgi:C-terminal processing protease CtpA/Prc
MYRTVLVAAATAGLTIAFAHAQTGISKDARDYLSAALEIMEKSSIRIGDLDWPSLRQKAYEQAKDAQVPADTYDAIRSVVRALGDGHSAFIGPQTVATMNQRAASMSPPPEAKMVNRIGYLRVPQFGSADSTVINGHATRLQELIKSIDLQHPCGWIVDLRQNGGGNMWPMLAGLGPLIGEGKAGAFVDGDRTFSEWYYRDGSALNGVTALARVTQSAHRLADQPPVAVLTSRVTASSGEAIVIAFQGRPNTRTFGEPTRGLSTSNQVFWLRDKAFLNLTTAYFADRTGKTYTKGITPDVIVENDVDEVPQPAREWLLSQPECEAK